ncbi:hypothetical protein AAF712_014035 [Marasmius tenuissimus]|uniref:Uncharacterized protein n=1 Tax=Marasmius tenuissimus TaxID=585030 RepID=A0ABR2ZDC5_9AGAR
MRVVEKAIVNSGFALLAISSGCISTMNLSTTKAVLVIFMLLAGFGGGLVSFMPSTTFVLILIHPLKTMQTTTIAVQASVARKDMSVATAFRNFMRNVGGALSVAVASSLINNALRASMKSLSLPESTISQIIDDPSILNSLSNGMNSTSISAGISVSQVDAQTILVHGYNKGFHDIFILNASLATFATIVSVLMIKHKELIRADDAEKLRQRRLLETGQKKKDEERGGSKEPEVLRAPVAEPLAVIGADAHEMEVLPKLGSELRVRDQE